MQAEQFNKKTPFESEVVWIPYKDKAPLVFTKTTSQAFDRPDGKTYVKLFVTAERDICIDDVYPCSQEQFDEIVKILDRV